MIFVCQNVYHNTYLEDNYTVSTCSKHGVWEPNPGNFCAFTAGINLKHHGGVQMYKNNSMNGSSCFTPGVFFSIEKVALSQSTIIIISVLSSSTATLLILLFIFGLIKIFGYYFKQTYTEDKMSNIVNEIPTQPYPTVLYEDIPPNFMQQNLEMEQNTAYGSAKQ